MTVSLNYIPAMLDVGLRIRKVRREKDISQEALAESVGVTGAYISKIENGRSDPDTGLLQKIARALDVGIVELLSDPPKNHPSGDLSIREPALIYFAMPGHISEAERARYRELIRRLQGVGPDDVETVLKLLDAVFPKKPEDKGDEKRNRSH